MSYLLKPHFKIDEGMCTTIARAAKNPAWIVDDWRVFVKLPAAAHQDSPFQVRHFKKWASDIHGACMHAVSLPIDRCLIQSAEAIISRPPDGYKLLYNNEDTGSPEFDTFERAFANMPSFFTKRHTTITDTTDPDNPKVYVIPPPVITIAAVWR